MAKLSGVSGHQKSQAELPKQLNQNPSEDELIKDRPSAQLPVTLSFGDMTINDQSMIGSTVPRMMRVTKSKLKTTVKKTKPKLASPMMTK